MDNDTVVDMRGRIACMVHSKDAFDARSISDTSLNLYRKFHIKALWQRVEKQQEIVNNMAEDFDTLPYYVELKKLREYALEYHQFINKKDV